VDKRELKEATEIAIPGYDHKVVFGVLTSFAYKLKDSGFAFLLSLTSVFIQCGRWRDRCRHHPS
jgi:hypothetical protein